jgi:hypothetical protein
LLRKNKNHNKTSSDLSSLQVLTNGGNDGADRDTGGRETEASNQGGNLGGELDEESAAVLVDDLQEVLNGGGDVNKEVTNVTSGLDNLANGDTDAGETKTRNESSNLGGELDEQLLSVGASDGQDLLNLGGEVTDDLVALLEGGTDGSEDGADGDTDGGETKTGDEASDLGGEGDEESTNVSTDNGDEAVNVGAKTGDKITEGAGGGDDGAERDTKGTEAEGGDQSGDLGAQLNEQRLEVSAGDGQNVVQLGAEVLDNVTILDSGGVGGGGGGGGKVEQLGQVTQAGDDGEVVQVKLLGDITELEDIGKAVETLELGQVTNDAGETGKGTQARGGSRSSESAGGQSGEDSNK